MSGMRFTHKKIPKSLAFLQLLSAASGWEHTLGLSTAALTRRQD
jgi:hypothetical protein